MVSVQFCKITKNFKLLADTFFWERLSNIVYQVYCHFHVLVIKFILDYIQWNIVATSTIRNFNNSSPLYLNFSNIINLCLNNWFIEDLKISSIFFWKRSRQKIPQIFHILKGPLFRNGRSYWYKYWRILRDFCGLSKNCGFWIFPKI